MHPILLYLLKMVGYSGVLILYYYLFLRDKQYHQYNRYYLLLTVVLSLLLPMISIPVFWAGTSAEAPLYVQTIELTTIGRIGHSEITDTAPSGNNLLLIVYLIISAAMLSLMVRAIRKVLLIRRKYTSVRWQDINFYNTEEKEAPFSFFRDIFWNKKIELDSDRGMQVFRHELYHTRQLHSADLAFMQLALSFAWFNPVFYIIKKELTTIHEYLADQFAISGADRHSYAEFIVASALQRQYRNPVTHYFFHSPLKRRITMILKNSHSHRFSYLERIMIIPLVAGLFFLFAFRAQIVAQEPVKPVSAQQAGKSPVAEKPVNAKAKPIPANDTVIKKVERETTKTLQRPKEPVKTSATTKPEKALSHEERRRDTIPLNHGEVTVHTENRPLTGSSKIFILNRPTGEKPLYIIDGFELYGMDKIKGEIKNVHIWEGSEAVKKFGEKGKNGVVVVTTTPDINTKRIEITFAKNTGYAELAAMKSYCEQRGITLNIRETKYNDQDELVYLSFEVDCGDGFKGAASARGPALENQAQKFGFYRDYSPNSASPFGTGSF